MSQTPVFKIIRLYFPKLEGHYLRNPKDDNYIQAHRIAVKIIDDKSLSVLFGISLQAEDKEQQMSATGVIAEVAAHIEMGTEMGKVEKLSDVPLMGNMLALLYPFLREKVNYFFSNNHLNILLMPINTLQIVKDAEIGPAVSIEDERQKKSPHTAAVKP